MADVKTLEGPWKPIETASLGRMVLGYSDLNGGQQCVGRLVEMCGGKGFHLGGLAAFYPTHWMPLPPNPDGSRCGKVPRVEANRG